jgi:hypothetical protein
MKGGFWRVLDDVAREKYREVFDAVLREVEGVVGGVVDEVYNREIM